MQTDKQRKLADLNEQIKERKAYLDQIEQDIEAVTTAGNNQLLIIHGQIEVQESRKAALLRENFALEQRIRENDILANGY